MENLEITNWRITNESLCIDYTRGDDNCHLLAAPLAAADLLCEAGICDRYEVDKNGEPVFYWTGSKETDDEDGNWIDKPCVEFGLWCEFVSSVPFFKSDLYKVVIAHEKNRFPQQILAA